MESQEIDKQFMVGKKFYIKPEAVNRNWRKNKMAEIVDEELFGEKASDMKYFIEVEGEKGLTMINGIMLIYLLKNNLIIPV